MRFIITIFCAFWFNHSAGQEFKYYNGPFKEGIAKYRYYETDDYERIYDGPFEYTNRDITIKGTYKGNKKWGDWSYVDHYPSSGKAGTNGKYIEDKRQGIWTYFIAKTEKNGERTVQKYSLNFKNDTIIGDVKIPGLTGKFDGSGNFINSWNIVIGDVEIIAEFDNNLLTKLIRRKISTGEIYSRYTYSEANLKLQGNAPEKKSYKEVLKYSLNFLGMMENEEEKKAQLNSLNVFFTQVSNELASLDKRKTYILQPERIIFSEPNLLVFQKKKIIESPIVQGDQAISYFSQGIGLDGDNNYRLGGRRALNKEKFMQDCNESGLVVVQIEVNQLGQVISARPGVKGTTNNTSCLLDPAKRAAMATRFNNDSKAPSSQVGTIIYNFKLSD